ncbi:MAG: hypothetical protein OXD30_11020 [Bryobacterales bacterium]|nr:hypothetical protein [Bryobacterales bacterium]
MADSLRDALRPLRAHGRPGPGLNLATSPAGGYRAFFALAGVVAVLLLGLSGLLVASFLRTEGKPEQLLGRQRQLLAEQRRLADAGADAARQMQSDSTAEILERTAFLNALLVRKGVSWSRTFLDLEVVLPPAVRMLTIRPEVAAGDAIRLDMAVSAKSPADFIGFLKALEESALFRAPAVRGSVPPSDGDPTFRYQLTVEYGQQI